MSDLSDAESDSDPDEQAPPLIDIFNPRRLNPKRARLPLPARMVLDKLDQIAEAQEQEDEDLQVHVRELEQLYRDAVSSGCFKQEKLRFQVLCGAVRLAGMDCKGEGEFGTFLGGPLMREIFDQGPLDLNRIDQATGRSVLLSACVGGGDESGIFLNWDATCILAANPEFACLDLTFHLRGDFHIGHDCKACLNEPMLVALIERNCAHPDPKVRATVNCIDHGDEYSLLQLACGARADSLSRKDLSSFHEFIMSNLNEPSRLEGEAIMSKMSSCPVVDHFQGSAAVIKALLEHPDFALVNYVSEDCNAETSALHMILSTQGAPVNTEIKFQGPSRGYNSHRHLSWDAKLAALNVFLDHAEANADKIDFHLRCGESEAFIDGHFQKVRKLLPAELARQVGFPVEVVQRMERITMPGLPSKIMLRVGPCILEYI